MFRRFKGFLNTENAVHFAKHCLRLIMFFAILCAVYFLQDGSGKPLHANVTLTSPCSSCPHATTGCELKDCR